MPSRQAPKPRAAAIYCRISHDPTGLRAGVQRQQKDCAALAADKGWNVDRVLVDNDISAYNGHERPAYQELLDAIRSGEIDAVVAWHPDRLHRRTLELEEFIEVVNANGVAIQTVQSGLVDLSTPSGRAVAKTLGTWAQYESEHKADRLKAKHKQLAEQGRGLWGHTVPFGYRYEKAEADRSGRVLVDPAAAKWVRHVFESFAEGASIASLKNELNERGVKGQRGKKLWYANHVSRMLDNPVYAGLRNYQGELTPGTWKPIVDDDLWQRVQTRRLATKARTPAERREGKGKQLLSGIFYCSCGERMYRDTYASNDERSAYKCARSKVKKRGDCTAGTILAHRAERLVTEQFLVRLTQPVAEAATANPRREPKLPAIEDESERLARIDAKMDRLLDELSESNGPLVARKIRDKLAALETERDSIQRAAAQDVGLVQDQRLRTEARKRLYGLRSDLPKVWERATTEERNAMLKAAVDRVVVVSGNGRMKTVDVEWGAT